MEPVTREETANLVSALRDLDKCIKQSINQVSKGETPTVRSAAPISLAPLPSQNVKRAEKVKVYVRVVFLKLGEINTVQEKFAADVFLQARWREPQLDGQAKDCERELANPQRLWSPKLHVENIQGDLKESSWHVVKYDKHGQANVLEKRRVKGTFFEKMELMEYPFDTQDLTVTLSTERGEQEVSIEADTSELSLVNVQSFVDEQEWFLHKHINHSTKITTNAYSNTKYKHPALSVSCKATRRFQFFFWNIILVMLFICSLVFSTFAVNYQFVQNRLQLSFILLLSNITFKFTVSGTLPKVSYLTYLDKYILISMAIQCVVCMWHAVVVTAFTEEEDAQLADRIALAVLAAIFLTFNASFLIWSRLLVSAGEQGQARGLMTQKIMAFADGVSFVAPVTHTGVKVINHLRM